MIWNIERGVDVIFSRWNESSFCVTDQYISIERCFIVRWVDCRFLESLKTQVYTELTRICDIFKVE